MQRIMMKSKIHRATVTEANVDYVGSITIDRDLMDGAGLYEYEQVAVVDVNNGARLETYVIEGPRGSGVICMNGAAARLIDEGDKVIIISYALYDEAELQTHEPLVVHVDSLNRQDVGHLAPAGAAGTSAGGDKGEMPSTDPGSRFQGPNSSSAASLKSVR
jgi:aspartate 1-decarboxylase